MALNDRSDLIKLIYVGDDTDVDVHLDAANLMVVEQLSVTSISPALSTERKKLIELYLAAHFTALAEEKGGLTRQGMGKSEDWYSDVYEAGLSSTRFGQQAVMFDSSGTLAKLSKGKGKAIFRVVRPAY